MVNFFKKEKVFILITILVMVVCAGIIYTQFNSSPSVAPGVTLPQGFPKMPIYPRARLVDSKSDPSEGALYIGVRYGATWEVKKDVPSVAKWYKDKLKEMGWTLDTESKDSEARDVQLVSFYNDDYTLNMSFTDSGDGKTTKITSEFNTHMRDICDDSNGKVCK